MNPLIKAAAKILRPIYWMREHPYKTLIPFFSLAGAGGGILAAREIMDQDVKKKGPKSKFHPEHLDQKLYVAREYGRRMGSGAVRGAARGASTAFMANMLLPPTPMQTARRQAYYEQQRAEKEDYFRRAFGSSGGTSGKASAFQAATVPHDALSFIGLNANAVRTKKEVNDRYRTLAKKLHPDVLGDEHMMKTLNGYIARVRASTWYQKLALIGPTSWVPLMIKL